MRHLQEYIKLFEAPAECKTVVGGLFKFPPETDDDVIIESILMDFCTKCAILIKEFYNPISGLSSLCTYDLFLNRWGINNPGDVSADDDAVRIFHDIPSDECAEIISQMEGVTMPFEDIRRMFGSGEFPAINIYKGHHQALNETHVTYTIGR